MKPRVSQPQLFSPNQLEVMTLVVKGASVNLRINDGVLLQFTTLNPIQVQTDPIQVQTAFYRVRDVTLVPDLDRTIVKLNIQGFPPIFTGTAVNLSAETFNAVKNLEKNLDGAA